MAASAQTIPARTGAAPFAEAEPQVTARRVVAFFAMVFGMFMAILDIQIVSASLSEIQAGISASADEIPWVQTSYLIAEVIMIPLSGFLSRALSTRYLFVISSAGFTLMSVLCSTASSVEEMIVWRALQGFIGGGMIPTVFASAFSIFPKDKQNVISPVIGLVATLAPTIGPTVGGYLTDLYSWHWLFLVNVVPGIAVTAVTWFLIDFDKPNFKLLEQFDWPGFISMAGFLGALEYILEEGPAKSWFDSGEIAAGTAISAICGVLFFARVLTAKMPVVDLSTFKDRNFWTGSLFAFVLGVGLYGLTYLYPVYLARVRGYSALQIGETMFITGLCMFLMAPVSGQLMKRGADPRLMLAIGFTGFAVGTYQVSMMTKDWDFNELLIPQNPARHLAHAHHDPGHEQRAWHHRAAQAQECFRPVQSDAQSWRRVRACDHQHAAQQAARSAPGPPARAGGLGARRGGRNAGQAHRADGALRLGCAACRHQEA